MLKDGQKYNILSTSKDAMFAYSNISTTLLFVKDN